MGNITRRFNNRENSEQVFTEIRKALDTSLLQLVNALEKHSVPYALDSGTLLGAFRDGESLYNDSDHDVSIKIEDLMTENGKSFLREFSAHFKRSEHKTRTFDKQKIEFITSAETLLKRFKSNKPFIISNLGWEALYDGKPLKYDTFSKRGPQKIDIFIQYPWNNVIGNGQDKTSTNHYVYNIPFYGVQFCKIPTKQVEVYSTVEMELNTIHGKVVKSFTAYSNIELYLIEMYGSGWITPDAKFNWFSAPKFINTKIKAKELFTTKINNSLKLQKHYLYKPM